MHSLSSSAPQFHIPEDHSSPVIMVGPGTGVAPFRGFWQQRMKDQSKRKVSSLTMMKQFNSMLIGFIYNCIGKQGNFGPMSLYFGRRTLKKDNVYQKEKAEMVDAGVLKPITVALSREPNIPKVSINNKYGYRTK